MICSCVDTVTVVPAVSTLAHGDAVFDGVDTVHRRRLVDRRQDLDVTFLCDGDPLGRLAVVPPLQDRRTAGRGRDLGGDGKAKGDEIHTAQGTTRRPGRRVDVTAMDTVTLVFHRSPTGAAAYATFLKDVREGRAQILKTVQADDRVVIEALVEPSEDGTTVFLSAAF